MREGQGLKECYGLALQTDSKDHVARWVVLDVNRFKELVGDFLEACRGLGEVDQVAGYDCEKGYNS